MPAYRKPILAAVFGMTVAWNAAPSVADTIEIQLPYGEADNSAIADIAPSAVHVSRIMVTASGISRAQQSAIGYDPEAVTECVNLGVDYPDLIISVGSVGSLLLTLSGYQFMNDGAFAISDTIPVDINLPDGHMEVATSYWYNIRAFYYQCVLNHWNCRVCTDALLEFAEYPLLTVEFEPVVRTEFESWGTVKAAYR